jgi:hypothetical protein
LAKCHAAKLILTAEAANRSIAPEPIDAPAKAVERQVIHQLREYDPALVHRPSPELQFERR